ncbi:hypothetical protein [Niallia circulans]|uniref:hypothetical protein n=1 Tax=Niallia circulans TaxID=1397 RepID=UPI001F3AB89C|nr:hypothetical protein [Niallia circulans]MCF2650876.1 hypothetical protein [Niallia circulans]
MNFQVYELMCDIVNKAYPPSDYPDNRFTKFFIKIQTKELKTIHGMNQNQLVLISISLLLVSVNIPIAMIALK